MADSQQPSNDNEGPRVLRIEKLPPGWRYIPEGNYYIISNYGDGNSVVRDLVARGEVNVGLTDTDDVNVAIEDGQPIAMVLPEGCSATHFSMCAVEPQASAACSRTNTMCSTACGKS